MPKGVYKKNSRFPVSVTIRVSVNMANELKRQAEKSKGHEDLSQYIRAQFRKILNIKQIKNQSQVMEKVSLKIHSEKRLSYFILNGSFVKIGSSTNPNNRFKNIQSANVDKLKLIYTTKISESELHEKFEEFRVKGEWFTYSKEIQEFIENEKIQRK
jgi:hypothetical protein